MHFKCLNNCNWPTRSSPEPKACNMGSFSLIKSSTDTLCRKPHRMEGIISQRCLSVIPQLPAGPSGPIGHRQPGWLWGLWAESHPCPSCCVCGAAERGRPCLSQCHHSNYPSATSPGCPSATPWVIPMPPPTCPSATPRVAPVPPPGYPSASPALSQCHLPACPSATPWVVPMPLPGCPPAREALRSPGSRRAAGGQPVSAIQVAG